MLKINASNLKTWRCQNSARLFRRSLNHQQSYYFQFTVLTLTFCSMILIAHSLYAFAANSIKGWLLSPKGSKAVNRVGGGVFVLFGVGLASTQK